MRSAAPAVEVPLGTGRRERRLTAGFYAAAGAAVGAWLAARHGFPTHVAGPAAGAAGAVLGWFAMCPMRGRLQWDGATWCLLPNDGSRIALGALDLRMDLGGWLLLRAVPVGRRRWFAGGHWCGISASEAGRHWHGLRLALYHGSPPVAEAAGTGG
jgi:hypothetical protein